MTLISVEEARRILLEQARPLDVETVALETAIGRVLAADVRVDRDEPPADRSAMDGYAVRAADLPDAPRTLRVAGEVRAGQAVERARVGPGEALRIFTGALVPPGADTVVMVEHTEEDAAGETVRVLEAPRPGQHIRRRGEDARRGDLALAAGTLVHAAEIAALAAVGQVRVDVRRLPRVGVLSTGDEVIEAQRSPQDHQVRNSNASALLALLRELGIAGDDLGIAGDDARELAAVLERGLSGDLLLITGGVSAGKYDLVRELLESAGMELLFHKIAMKPGKPVLAGRRRGCLVAGLPGNPVSAFTTFRVLVAPALRRMMGHRHVDDLAVRATLSEPLACKPGRDTFHLARVEADGARFVARPVRSSSSGDVLSLVRANAYLVTPADAASLPAGAEVDAVLWREFHLRPAADRPAGD